MVPAQPVVRLFNHMQMTNSRAAATGSLIENGAPADYDPASPPSRRTASAAAARLGARRAIALPSAPAPIAKPGRSQDRPSSQQAGAAGGETRRRDEGRQSHDKQVRCRSRPSSALRPKADDPPRRRNPRSIRAPRRGVEPGRPSEQDGSHDAEARCADPLDDNGQTSQRPQAASDARRSGRAQARRMGDPAQRRNGELPPSATTRLHHCQSDLAGRVAFFRRRGEGADVGRTGDDTAPCDDFFGNGPAADRPRASVAWRAASVRMATARRRNARSREAWRNESPSPPTSEARSRLERFGALLDARRSQGAHGLSALSRRRRRRRCARRNVSAATRWQSPRRASAVINEGRQRRQAARRRAGRRAHAIPATSSAAPNGCAAPTRSTEAGKLMLQRAARAVARRQHRRMVGGAAPDRPQAARHRRRSAHRLSDRARRRSPSSQIYHGETRNSPPAGSRCVSSTIRRPRSRHFAQHRARTRSAIRSAQSRAPATGMGRAAEALDRTQEARTPMSARPQHSTSYYGQLARAKLGLPQTRAHTHQPRPPRRRAA